jgi:UDP-3-O-[3-hydroxymyristoyl] glucosamine N-acyltransferase
MKTLGELSEIVSGQLSAQPNIEITGAASIARALESEITFVTSAKHFDAFLNSDASAAIVGPNCELSLDETSAKPYILVDDVAASFVEIVELFQPPVMREKVGISPDAIVSPSARISDNVCIHAGAVVMDDAEIGYGSIIYPNATIMENCQIGSNVKIFPGAVLYENTIVGDRAIIHSGVVLGAFGFGYKSNSGRHVLSAQLGNVVIGDDVEIGANTTIDRGTYDSTTVGNGTKMDNLVMVGHNCVIGEHNLLCSQVGIAGSCTTGDYVVMGGQVGLADHLDIGSHVSIGAKSGLMHSIEDNQKVFGIPARPAREEMQILASKAKLPEIRKTIKKMVKQIEQLSNDPQSNQEQESNSEETRAA